MSFSNLGKKYNDGEWIVRQGEIGHTMHIIQKGKVEVLLERPNGELRLSVLGEGEIFGEMALFTRESRSASVRSIGETRILTVDKRGFMKRMQEDPSLVFRILQKMASRVKTQNQEIERLQKDESFKEMEYANLAALAASAEDASSDFSGADDGRTKVLITGANGYIGRRLKRKLLEDASIVVRLFVRNLYNVSPRTLGLVEVVEGSVFEMKDLKEALKGIDTAYYLIQTELNKKDYEQRERTAARNFLEAAISCGVRRIVYLGTLGDRDTASKLEKTRMEVGDILSSRPEKIQTLWLRAGVIIGSGSESFEVIRILIQKLPILIAPKWVNNKTQPIGVGDVLQYLADAKDLTVKENLTIDIGGEIKSYREMMEETAEIMGLRRWFFSLPFSFDFLSAYWLAVFTPLPYYITREMILGVKSELLLKNRRAKELFPLEPESFKKAVLDAVRAIERSEVVSRWSDSGSGDIWEKDHQSDIASAAFMERRRLPLCGIPPEKIYKAFTSIGGEQGWFKYSWLWEIRGFMDKLMGGYGLNRGRRDPRNIRLGDSIDFWKVVKLEENHYMLLYAKMLVPGKAWLEFMVDEGELVLTAYFQPSGLMGRLYWYSMVPAHHFIFSDLAWQIIRKAKKS